jgi:predicted aminopeptidase
VIFRDLVHDTREQLQAVYAGGASEDAKRAAKTAAFLAMKGGLCRRQERGSGHGRL